MSFTVAGNYGNAAVAATASALTWTAQQAVTANSGFVVAVVASLNQVTGDVSSGIATEISGGGVTWVKLGEWTNGNAATNTGAMVAAFLARPTASDMTLSTLCVVKMVPQGRRIQLQSFKGNYAGTGEISIAAVINRSNDDTGSLGAATISGLATREYMFLAAMGAEESVGASFAEMANYTGNEQGTGTVAGNQQRVRYAYRILTGTGDIYDPSTEAVDIAQLYFALYEVSATLTASIHALLQKGLTVGGSLDAKLLHELSLQLGLDAKLQKALARSFSIDAVLRGEVTKTAQLAAVLQKALTLTAGLEAALLGSSTKTAQIGAALLNTLSRAAALDALLDRAAEITLQAEIDAILTGLWLKSAPTSSSWAPATPQA